MKIDWDRYVDEDEEEEGFDTSMLDGGMGMGGMPGMGVSSFIHFERMNLVCRTLFNDILLRILH